MPKPPSAGAQAAGGQGGRRGVPFLAALLLVACDGGAPDLRLVGTVERTLVELVAPISEVIIEVSVERGDHVTAGEIVVRLDPTLAVAEIASAQASLASARAETSLAEAELRRLRNLRAQQVASEQQLDQARRTREEAAARLRGAEARLIAVRKREQDLSLRSPVDGVIDQIAFEVGERVPSGAVLAVVLEDDDPWVRVWIPEHSFATVAPGMPAEIDIDGVGRTLRGSVLDVAREPEFTPHYALTERDRVYLVYETRVRIHDAPASLRPGIPADVRLLPKQSAEVPR